MEAAAIPGNGLTCCRFESYLEFKTKPTCGRVHDTQSTYFGMMCGLVM